MITGSATPSFAGGGLFANTPADHDLRCLVNLGGQEALEPITLQKLLATLPADCHARCPFRNITESFYLRRIKGVVLRQSCWAYVLPPASLSSTSGGGTPSRSGRNIVVIYQDGSGNIIAVYQHGSGDISVVLQDGSGNSVNVTQNGLGNTAGIAQFGNGNTLNLTQNGDDNSFRGVQTGSKSLTWTQNGNQTQASFQ